jgi:hypothetical protein
MFINKALPGQNIKSITFATVFTALAVMLPMVTHYFAGAAAGRLLLPMHLFVLLSGLLLGWRSGLFVGAMTALISFSLTGMPMMAILPLIAIELMIYGALTGYFHQTKKWPVLPSLIVAIILGRIMLWSIIAVLPIKIAATSYVISALQAGLFGIITQIILVPIVYKSIANYIENEKV